MQKIAIIIPCYNEDQRLSPDLIRELLNDTTASVYLVNDGSTDNTLQLLNRIAQEHPGRCVVLDYKENTGKANSIYKAVNYLLDFDFDYIGYFDADFSTPPPEINRMIRELQVTNPPLFIFGSRILLLNANINRKWYRHVIGRSILTLINLRFKLGIYDTQCGAKIFSADTARVSFSNKFYTSWLFDVEVFIRLHNQDLLHTGHELPLKSWKDVDGSKLGWKEIFRIIKELHILNKKY